MKHETRKMIADYLVNSLEHAINMHVAVSELSDLTGMERQRAAKVLYAWISGGHHLTPVMTDETALKILSELTDK